MKASNSRHVWFMVAGLTVILVALLWRLPRVDSESMRRVNVSEAPAVAAQTGAARVRQFPRAWRPAAGPGQTAAEVVAGKMNQFARSRREIVHAMAARFKMTVPAEVEQFFDAAEAGRWDDMKALYEAMSARRRQPPPPTELQTLWPALLETLGVAEAVQDWPAENLLDYGNSILGSLRPGMIYVGGTDPGRFIPTLLNETGDGERHVVLTQNALADGTYLDYVRFLHGDHLAALTKEDSQRAFQEYISDAQKRWLHDQQFPDEPKQIRPGEDVRVADGKTQVGGQIAVMAINEKLVQTLMSKNPDASFAIEQSFPFTSMYGDTRLLGPIMELRGSTAENPLNSERAGQAIEYWRSAADQLTPDLEATGPVRMTYGKMAAEQAALLLHHGYRGEAEEALRLASEMGPGSPEAVFGYVKLLVDQKRFDDALRVAERAVQVDLERQHEFGKLVDELNGLKQK